jgi:hypothetical protein
MRDIKTIDAREYIKNNFDDWVIIPADNQYFDFKKYPKFKQFITLIDQKYGYTDDSYYIASDPLFKIKDFKTKEILEIVCDYLEEKE